MYSNFMYQSCVKKSECILSFQVFDNYVTVAQFEWTAKYSIFRLTTGYLIIAQKPTTLTRKKKNQRTITERKEM